ncbi:carboxymuconolactone decarboxylase, partial [Protomyces lactucae-debilis]
RRRGGTLLELDRMLLRAPPLAAGWNHYMGAIRSGTSLTDAIRELSICYVAVLNNADYEWQQHVGLAIKAGVSTSIMDQVHDDVLDALDDEQRLVLDYTRAMTRDISVQDDLFAKVKDHFSEVATVELTATIAAYNMVSRFLVALHIG